MISRQIQLTVNGRSVDAGVEPRMQLADFLREQLGLTGTHLGCEHGVCGACTLEVDGVPVRSCITYAVACDGSRIRTIEGLDNDEIAGRLRRAFSREHALQCGFCTPGMLTTARDIVVRLPEADEKRIRIELSGNLCRCTGYNGIVRAIMAVILEMKTEPRADLRGTLLGPAGSRGVAASSQPGRAGTKASANGTSSAEPDVTFSSVPVRPGKPTFQVQHSVKVSVPREIVWRFFARLDEVVKCMPGASLTEEPTDDRVKGLMRVQAGPITAEFHGVAEITRDPMSFSGTIQGQGKDRGNNSTTAGEVRYRLVDEDSGRRTAIVFEISAFITGPLAQFSRGGLVQQIAKTIAERFAKNVQQKLLSPDGDEQVKVTSSSLNMGAIALKAMWQWMGGAASRWISRR
ncbi:xanthine dehydrogenase family Fe-S subunit [Mesorhizobium sp. CO1-1-8]|uniref:xanthine dehydrogenase family Fe-S subunit n=1 Tax=Mesorhizobium sp. CO1-1-8 TaxID=2876631 RepID=UPI001CD0500A|nr:2Fe-2S iron-sulfur cluster-binding protein [Mesorhizobium sp. CO1-1-8]MBZ9772418.1 2Fe-2S iron-sulfur cluster binding domain-containing protein [Mesorhizobium sp. CO1-1-8]